MLSKAKSASGRRKIRLVFAGIIVFFNIAYAQYDVTTGRIINTTNEPQKLSLQKKEKTATYSVLWDTTHGIYSNYYLPSGRYSRLTALLDSNDYCIDVVDTGIGFMNLSGYDVIVINSACAWDSFYQPSEVDSLAQYIKRKNGRVLLVGDCNFCDSEYIDSADNKAFALNAFNWLLKTGGILIMSENAYCPNQNIAPVANAFNMNVGLSTLYPLDLYFTNLASHYVFSGISNVYFRAGGEISASSPSEAIAWDDSGRATIAVYDAGAGIEDPSILVPPGRDVASLQLLKDKIYLSAPKSINAELKIYDLCGRTKEVIYNGILSKGDYVFTPNIKKSGVYFVRVSAGNIKETKKLILMK
ncbi:MAG: T9SS type A sorting domain-containing protein [bacterium]|nr:T9SS type A sorting domain-containing protein [bacterium]